MSSQSTTENRTWLPAEALRVYLLGPPEVEWAGLPLAIPRRQTRALLYYLANRLQPAPRETLCFLFWPDVPETAARLKLSRLLTHLRRALPYPHLLLTPADLVQLDPDRTWSDTSTFDHLCTVQAIPRRTQALQHAVGLYRGPFLAGLSLPDSPEFEAWAMQERHTRERCYLEALASLIEDRTTHGAYDDAIAYAQDYLATDALAEEVHRCLIELYAATGNRSAALHQFEHCVEVLERELGVDPLPETHAAYRTALKGQHSSLARPRSMPEWRILPGLDTPLVGRDDALRQLERAWARAGSGHGDVVLIAGEPGIGKSRLVQDFAGHLQRHALVLMGSARPGARALPYHPVTEALRTALRRGEGGTSILPLSLPPVWLAEATRLLPELHTLYPDLPPPASPEPEEARGRLFEALCRLVLGLATGSRPLLLCLDDLQWADDATLAWLVYLGPHLRHSRILLLGAYRTEEASILADLRHSLSRLNLLSEMTLSGLDTAAVRQLLCHLLGPIPDEAVLATRLQQVTGGNPFFLLETLRALIETGRLPGTLSDLQDPPLPDSVRDAVHERILRLSSVARQVLEASAVLGQTFGFDPVYLTAGRGELGTMDGLDELVARQLLIEQDGGYRLIADYQRSLDYRQQALVIRSEPGRMARVAEDLTDMGILCTRLGRLPEAEQYLNEALTLARKIGSQVAESYALNQLGTLHYVRGDYPAALQCHADSLVLQRATGSRRGEASALNNLGIVHVAIGDFAGAEAPLRESLAIYSSPYSPGDGTPKGTGLHRGSGGERLPGPLPGAGRPGASRRSCRGPG